MKNMQSDLLWKNKRNVVLILTATTYFALVTINASYLLPVYHAKLGYSPQEAGWLITGFYITSTLSRLFLGNVIVALGFKRIFLLAGLISIAGSIGVATGGLNFWLVMLSRGAQGLGVSLFQVSITIYQALAFSSAERGRAYSLIMAGNLAPMMSVVPLADWMLFNGYDNVYILIPIISTAAAILFTRKIPTLEIPSETKPTAGHFKSPFYGFSGCFRIPFFRLAMLSLFLFALTDALAAFMSPMTTYHGLPASLFLTANAIFGVGMRLFFGKTLDRFPRWKLSIPIIIIMLLALLLVSAFPSKTSMIALGSLFGIGMGFGFPLNIALVSDAVPSVLQPQAISLAWFIVGFSFGFMPILSGWLGESMGPTAAFQIIAFAILSGQLLLNILWAVHHRKASKQLDLSH